MTELTTATEMTYTDNAILAGRDDGVAGVKKALLSGLATYFFGKLFPDLTGNAGKYLKANATEDGVEWGTPAGGGGGSALEVLNEGVSEDAAVVSIDFVGAGVTATQTSAGNIEVNIPGGGGGGGGAVTADPTRISSPRWRFYVPTDTALGGPFVAIGEIKFYEADGVTAIPTTGGTPIASSYYDGAWMPAEAFDGALGAGNGWISSSSGVKAGQWIGYVFTADTTPYYVSFAPQQDYPAQLPDKLWIEFSLDGVFWHFCGLLTLAGGVAGVYQTFPIPEFVNPNALGLIASGGGGVSSGTSFPGSPADNDLFYRTDRDILYYYDSALTKWLSVNLYTQYLYSGNYGATDVGHCGNMDTTNGFYMVDMVTAAIATSGTVTGNLKTLDGATVATLGTFTRNVNSWASITTTINTLVASTVSLIFLNLAGSGGGVVGSTFRYRLIG